MTALDIPEELRPVDEDAIRKEMNRLYELDPDAKPFVKNLIDAGLLKEWRSLKSVSIPKPRPKGEFRELCLPGNDFCTKKDKEQ